MTDSSLFTWITRYRPTERRNPREDMLTQAFAGVLDAVEGLPRWLVTTLVQDVLVEGSDWQATQERVKALLADDGSTEINTQVPCAHGVIDLEIHFTGQRHAGALIWIESKHGADLSPGQLSKYAKALEIEDVGTSAQLLISPIGFEYGENDMPVTSAGTTWSRVGGALKEWLHEFDPPADRYDRWLVGQFLDYLRKEHLLYDEPIRADSIDMGRKLQEVKGQTEQFLGDVEARVNGWVSSRPNLGHGTPSTKHSAWPLRTRLFTIDYQLDPMLGSTYWLEWRIGDNPAPGCEDPARWTIAAGIGFLSESMAAKNAASVADSQAIKASGLCVYPDFSDCAWIMASTDLWNLLDHARSASPEEYESQVEEGARWITKHFEDALAACAPGAFNPVE